MLLLKIIGIAFVSLVGVNILKNSKADFSVFIIIGAGCIIIILLSDKIVEILDTLKAVADKSTLNGTIFSLLIKIVGLGYITEYASSVCDDCNCTSLGKKIELAGKITIFAMAVPIVVGVIDAIGSIL